MKNAQSGKKIRLVMLASGSGSNVENFLKYFRDHPLIEVTLIATNNATAPVIQRAATAGVPCEILTRKQWEQGTLPLKTFREHSIDFIILAGFLQLIPQNLIQAYAGRIVNIHPALLPKYGGKGMYGLRVHEAVIASREAFSGISIHLVNENYDEGAVIFQERVAVEAYDTAQSLAQKVHKLEYAHYPRVVEEFVLKNL